MTETGFHDQCPKHMYLQASSTSHDTKLGRADSLLAPSHIYVLTASHSFTYQKMWPTPFYEHTDHLPLQNGLVKYGK